MITGALALIIIAIGIFALLAAGDVQIFVFALICAIYFIIDEIITEEED